ncbi:hypothetical protein [Persephonella sp.]
MKVKIIPIFLVFVLITGVSFAIQGLVKPENVCMVNDRHLGVKQIPVEVDGKVYYGCCKMCVGRIKNNENIRYAIDPVSKKKVDKATALILALKDGRVLYFENRENVEKFLKSFKID